MTFLKKLKPHKINLHDSNFTIVNSTFLLHLLTLQLNL